MQVWEVGGHTQDTAFHEEVAQQTNLCTYLKHSCIVKT